MGAKAGNQPGKGPIAFIIYSAVTLCVMAYEFISFPATLWLQGLKYTVGFEVKCAKTCTRMTISCAKAAAKILWKLFKAYVSLIKLVGSYWLQSVTMLALLPVYAPLVAWNIHKVGNHSHTPSKLASPVLASGPAASATSLSSQVASPRALQALTKPASAEVASKDTSTAGGDNWVAVAAASQQAEQAEAHALALASLALARPSFSRLSDAEKQALHEQGLKQDNVNHLAMQAQLAEADATAKVQKVAGLEAYKGKLAQLTPTRTDQVVLEQAAKAEPVTEKQAERMAFEAEWNELPVGFLEQLDKERTARLAASSC